MSETEIARVVRQVMKGYVPWWAIVTLVTMVASGALAWGGLKDNVTQNSLDIQVLKAQTAQDHDAIMYVAGQMGYQSRKK